MHARCIIYKYYYLQLLYVNVKIKEGEKKKGRLLPSSEILVQWVHQIRLDKHTDSSIECIFVIDCAAVSTNDKLRTITVQNKSYLFHKTNMNCKIILSKNKFPYQNLKNVLLCFRYLFYSSSTQNLNCYCIRKKREYNGN